LKKSLLLVSALAAFVPAVTFASLMNTVPVTTGGSSVVPGLVTANPGTFLVEGSISGAYYNSNDSKVTDYTLREAAYKDSSGAVDFYLQLASSYNGQMSANSLIQALIGNFTTYSTSVGYRSDGSALTGASGFTSGTIAPSTADRATGFLGYNTVFFDFGAGLTGGAVSDVLIISTNASSYTTIGSLGVSDNASEGSSSGSIYLYSPSGPTVPDSGSSALLLGVAFVSLAGLTCGLRSRKEV
jgi:hypothetical protein